MNKNFDKKMMMVYINESHKNLLEDFFDSIGFYYYTIQNKVESVWSEKIKHKNSSIWPGTDCIFFLSVPADKVDDMLVKLKTFRASMPYKIVLSVGVVPLERSIFDLLGEDEIEVDQELLLKIKNEGLGKKKK